ncbi:hypothetical protein ACO0RG_000646 [Hanseniaspora osmophila]
MNFSATVNCFKLIFNPKLCYPQLQISTFSELPVLKMKNELNIKAVVLDKDNCFAFPYENHHYPPETSLLIVSNSAGTNDDPGLLNLQEVEKSTGVPVLKHSTKKPGCHEEILDYFIKQRQICQSPREIAIVGDRLFTDIIMANTMKSYGIYVKDGVKISNSPIVNFEKRLFDLLKV